MKPASIAFAGTPAVAAQLLDTLIQANLPLVGVFTQPDRAAGRGQQVQISPVKQRAEQAGLPVFQPEHFKSPENIALLEDLKPDLLIVMAYGLILPSRILNIPQYGCINLHTSLLPAYRGAAPVQRAILAGDEETGITWMRMERGLDTGPILLQKRIAILKTDTSETLLEKLTELGGTALLEFLDKPSDFKLQPQDEAGASYAAKITAEEALLDWEKTAWELDCAIRAYQPWPIAFKPFQGNRLRIFKAVVENHAEVASPGRIVAFDRTGICVQTGKGQLRVQELQFPGKKRMDATAIWNGYQRLFKVGEDWA